MVRGREAGEVDEQNRNLLLVQSREPEHKPPRVQPVHQLHAILSVVFFTSMSCTHGITVFYSNCVEDSTRTHPLTDAHTWMRPPTNAHKHTHTRQSGHTKN